MDVAGPLLTLLAGLLGAFLLLADRLKLPRSVLRYLGLIEEDDRVEASFEDRVQTAVAALTAATMIVGELEREIDSRSEAVRELQRQHHLLELDRDQIRAIAFELTGVVREEGRRSLAVGIAASALFFLAGAGVTLLAS